MYEPHDSHHPVKTPGPPAAGLYKIFIVEDDPVILEQVSRHLSAWGYGVETVKDFSAVTAEFARYGPHLALLDIGLPFHNGYYWCGALRKLSSVPIIFLSSASDNMNIVMAMNMGGDDFIPKPFDLNVLSAKVQAMLRRAYDFQPQSALLEHRGVILNQSDATLTTPNGKIDLTKNEFRILQLLYENKGAAVSRERIMQRLWESDSFIDDNTLTVNMTRLRRKLEEGGVVRFIATKKGLGYLLETEAGEFNGR